MKLQRMARRLCAASAVPMVLTATARATDFAVTSGNFSAGSSWVGGQPPTSIDDANINNGGTALFNPGDNFTIDRLHVATDPGTTGNLTMSGGTLNVLPFNGDPDDNTIAIGEFGVGHFTMSGGTINLGTLAANDYDFHVGKSSMGSTMTMTGGTINMGGTFRVARGQAGDASSTVSILGGTLNTGAGIVVGRGDNTDTFNAEGTFIVGGTGKFIAGNSMGEGVAAGFTDEGFFSVANRVKAVAHVTVKDTGVIKALRFTGRQGHADITIQDSGKFLVVNTLGANGGAIGAGGLYGSYLGGGDASNGDGSDGNSGVYSLTLKGSGLLDVDANASGRDTTRPELQGFILARGNSTATATIQDSAQLVVRQRFVIGGVGAHADFNGFDGGGAAGTDPGGTATVTMTGGALSTDQLVVGGSGTGTFTVSGGTVQTLAYGDTYDPSADMGNGSSTTSVNSIRIGMLMGSTGVMNVSGTAHVSTGGDLGIGQYGTGTLKVTGGGASISAKDVFIQKFQGSAGTLIAEITGPTQTSINASESVTINGGTFQVVPTAVPATGAHLYSILVANAGGGSGSGTLTGKFQTVTLPPDDALGRRWSAIYLPTKFEVGLAIPGDTNFDGNVNFNDLLTLAQHYGQNGQWIDGNFNGDSAVNFNDLLLLAQNYGSHLSTAELSSLSPSFQSDVQRAFAAVPEPTFVGVMALGLIAIRRRRAL